MVTQVVMKRIWLAFIFIVAMIAVSDRTTAVKTYAQESTPSPEQTELQPTAAQLLENMSGDQRVGQLFLVTFQGDAAFTNPDIINLITQYHIGGVVLDRDNNNLTGYGSLENVPVQAARLTNELQSLALSGTAVLTDTTASEEGIIATPPSPLTNGIPLLIAINHEGDGYPFSHIMNGMTELPSNMALGATWQPENAQIVGDVAGKELAAIGVNMLLGPVLDVLEHPDSASSNNLGVRPFGGDPYWVGLMGQAYTEGVHLGSNGRVAVIAKHFPGFGGSDRPLHESIPTVQKSLNQLQSIDLIPFYAVTGNAQNSAETVDGLLSTHIRYQGFQGNIQSTTNPLSLDPQALNTLMNLPQLSIWRNNGGIIISDALGTRAIERFYDDTEQSFPHRVVAKDAFLAGNDLLYLADFKLGDAPYEEQLANTIDTITWFQERYRTDIAFQQQVDTAVLRILTMKLRLYENDFSAENVLVDANAEAVTAVVGQSNSQMVEIAQEAISLLSPSPEVLAERLPRPPGPQDRIIIFTDLQTAQQCSSCPLQSLINQTAFADRILDFYGPQSSGQVEPGQITSFTFNDLNAFLTAESRPIIYNTAPVTPTIAPGLEDLENEEIEEGPFLPYPTATPPPEYLVQESLNEVDWIIFVLLDESENSQVLSDFLATRPDLLRNNQVVAFAFNVPGNLDTTEITQLTAYYGAFSKINTFLDASVRALFQELPLNGSPPIDVSGINYSLNDQTRPDPNQIISLSYQREGEQIESSAEEALSVSVGDTLRLITGVILDQNGNPVPDNTIVRFIERDRIEGSLSILAEVPTINGIAQLSYVLEARTEGGEFRIGVEAGGATISQELDFSVSDSAEGAAQIRLINPTPNPTRTPTPTNTATPTTTPTFTPTPVPSATPEPPPADPQEPGVRIELSEFWMLTAVSLGLLFIIVLAFLLGNRTDSDITERVGRLLWGVISGLLFYLYYALDLPGTAVFSGWGFMAGVVTTAVGGLVGLAAFQVRHKQGRAVEEL